MNFLFIHQNFPGQFCHIASELAEQGHNVVGLGINSADPNKPLSEKVQHIRYKLLQGNSKGIHRFAAEMETKTIRGDSCAYACSQLKKQGFTPDLIYGHPGWGELLFVKTIWPGAPMISFQEYFYNETGFDAGFDPEFSNPRSWETQSGLIMKNTYLYLTLEQADWNVTPTRFQMSTYPDKWKHRFSAIHDGVNIRKAKPLDKISPVKLKDGYVARQGGEQIITFVNRRLEPYRGFHIMMRAIPEIQKKNPKAHIVIVGSETGTSYGAKCKEGEWKDYMMKEVGGMIDESLVHFTGSIHHDSYIRLLQLSSCHIYLTYPFVLSWSMLEAMACGTPVIGSNTAPVQEVITHNKNGLIVDFFSPTDIANYATELLKDKLLAKRLGDAGREHVVKNYSVDSCINKQLSTIQMVMEGNLGF